MGFPNYSHLEFNLRKDVSAMAIKQGLDLRQSQSLTMTPQLQQAIKLLQMTNLELADYVEQEIERNPLLEMDERTPDERRAEEEARKSKSEESFEAEQKIAEQAAAREDQIRENQTQKDDTNTSQNQDSLDTNFENVFTGESEAEKQQAMLAESQAAGYESGAVMADVGSGGSHNFEGSEYSLENTVSDKPSLRAHIFDQINVSFTDDAEKNLAIYMFDYLDETGYMRRETSEIADKLGCEETFVETVLGKLQHLDPTGVFARDLGECLALQLQEMNRFDPAMEKLLKNLDLLAAYKLPELKKICGVDDEDLADMILEIKALNPRPIGEYEHFVSQTVVPDVLMRPLPKSLGGGWAVELNQQTLPRVLVNQRYYQEIKGSGDKDAKSFISDQFQSANWLAKSLDQRAQTIMKVAGEIIRRQEPFFTYGIAYLKPMILKDIAEAIDMHESTISRVTTNKYIETPRGIFELKFFFGSGVSGDSGDGVAAQSVKARIKALTDAEDPKKILSDDALVALLKEEGIDLARRTVAKYREAMNIPSSVQRRRQKKLNN